MGAIISAFLGIWIHLRLSPAIMGKRDGIVQYWSYIFFWPLHLMQIFFSLGVDRVNRMFRTQKETDCTVITKNFFLGGKYSSNALGDDQYRVTGVVDLTNEFSALSFPNKQYYWNVQTWDSCAPEIVKMELAIEDIKKTWWPMHKDSDKAILIHCAYGRGRSATFLTLLLCRLGFYDTWESAFEAIKAKRPYVKLSGEMKKALSKSIKQ